MIFSRRRSRFLFSLTYIAFFYWVILLIRNEYIAPDPTIVYEQGGEILVSVYLDTSNTEFLPTINYDESIASTRLGTFFQSQNLVYPVFLSFISIDSNAPNEQYCFSSFHIEGSTKIPKEIIPDNEADTSIVFIDEHGNYLLKNPICLSKGGKYFFPSIFVGFATSEAYADFGIDKIVGSRAFEFFPFDEQEIVLNLIMKYTDGVDKEYLVTPSLEVILDDGWIGKAYKDPDNQLTIQLSRPRFYRVLLVTSTLTLMLVISLLRLIVDAAGGFFEVMFGLMVGLTALYDVLKPDYIGTSIPINIFIYFLFMLILGEMMYILVNTSLSQLGLKWGKESHTQDVFVKEPEIEQATGLANDTDSEQLTPETKVTTSLPQKKTSKEPPRKPRKNVVSKPAKPKKSK